MEKIILFIIFSTISGCLFQKVAGTSHDTESTNEISLTGKVIDENNDPVKGVVVSLAKRGISDTTDENGEYHIEKDEIEIDSGLIEGKDILDTLIFVQDSQVVANINITKWIDTLPDVKIVQRDISGKLELTNQIIGKVEAILSGDGIPEGESLVAEFFYSEVTYNYSGFIYFPVSETKQNYSAYINVYNPDGKFIGRSEPFLFNSLAGDIIIPTFDPGNAIPTPNAGSDTVLSINDTLGLRGTAIDSFGGNIDKWEWDIGGGGTFIETFSGDTTIILPPDSMDNYLCVLKVTDNDGNSRRDSISIIILKDKPILDLIGNSTIKITQSITFKAQVSQQFGNIVMFKWDDGVAPGWDDSSSSLDSVDFTYTSKGIYPILVSAEDDDGNISVANLNLSVTNDDPIISEMKDSVISIKDEIKFNITAEDPEGIKEYWWDWDGDGINEDTTLTNENSHTFPDIPQTEIVVVTVLDNFDGRTTDTIIISVVLDNPIVNAGKDTLVSINDSIHLKGSVTDSLGSISKIEWNIGGTGFVLASTTDTTILAPSIENSDYLAILKATDDDSNVVEDSIQISIVMDPPIAEITGLDSVRVDSIYSLSASSSSPGVFGSIVKYEWSIGSLDSFVVGSGLDTALQAPNMEKSDFNCALRVTDEDGNIDTDTINISFYKKWDVLGQRGFSAGRAEGISVDLDGNIPFVAFGDMSVDSGTTVMKYTGSNWEILGKPAFSSVGLVAYVSFALEGNTPYVAFSEMNNGLGATVMKFNGSEWDSVGQRTFSEGDANYNSLILDGNTPYLAFRDAQNGGLTVMRFNGTSWVPMGEKGFSEGSPQFISMAIAGGTPYVAYADQFEQIMPRTSVVRWDGNQWVPLGGLRFSEMSLSDILLDFDGNTPYILYRNQSEGNPVVKRFVGSQWEMVGQLNDLGNIVESLSLAMDGSTPYIAFRDQANGSSVTVMKFNGSEWQVVGQKGFSNGFANHISLKVNDGTPYVSFGDESFEGKVSVMVYR